MFEQNQILNNDNNEIYNDLYHHSVNKIVYDHIHMK